MKKITKVSSFIFLLSFLIFSSCDTHNQVNDQKFKIIAEVANNANSPFYLSLTNYPKQRKKLPIGVFDSGTGGLTVLNSIYEMDSFNNADKSQGQDGILDFKYEKFIYLADESNMPYGRYDAEGKADFLRELVIKDVRFLLGDSYYDSPGDEHPQQDKQPVKAIVIACNTATAYGLETVQQAVKDWGLDIRIMGIVDAGSKAVLPNLQDPSNKMIGVLATEGTCSSQGYPKSIKKNYKEMYGGQEIAVVQQAGIGLAGAIDGDLNYIDPKAIKPKNSDSYKGPDIGHPNYPLDLALWEAYHFEEGNSLLTEYDEEGRMIHAQLNSVNNYIRYMATHLLINAQNEFPDKSISRVILGCTHYPYFEAQIKEHFFYLKSLNSVYDQLIDENIQFIDPSESLAVELHQYLNEKNLWADNKNEDSQFYISVPNILLKENQINDKGEFPYDYKYGRLLNSSLQYAKVVPFSDEWIKASIQERMRDNIPYTHKMIYQN